MDNVEIKNCSQANTFKAAVRFEMSTNVLGQVVKNSVIHGSLGWGAQVKSSKFVTMQNNVIVGARAIGLNLLSI